MAPPVKSELCEREDLSSVPSTHIKIMLGTVMVCAYHLSTGEVETGDPWDSMAGQPR